jgi:hypothetical protein
VAYYINNLAALDTYDPALTLGPFFDARNAVVTVANNPALMQFAVGELGRWRWTDEREFLSIPQSFKVSKVVGIRFRNANPGVAARILAVLAGDDDVQIDSGTPFTGLLSATGQVTQPVAASAAARVHKGAPAQSIPNAVLTALTFDATDYDTNGIVNLAGFPTRLTCQTAGVYALTAAIEWQASAGGSQRVVFLRINGGPTIIAEDVRPPVGGGAVTAQTVTAEYQLAVGDYVEALVFQDSGGALNANVQANYSPVLSMAKQP